MSLVAAVSAALLPAGLNLIAALPVERYDGDVPERYRLRKRHPTGRSLIVIGSGGGEFWRGFRRHCAAQPGLFERTPHPLDQYTASVIEDRVPPLLVQAGVTGHVLYPFRFDTDPVSFMHLGAVAGFGTRSRLGVLVHPEYGPWIALRAALLLDVAIAPTPVTPFDPCGTCADTPCIGACPASAINERGWDVPACTAYRVGFPGPEGTVDEREPHPSRRSQKKGPPQGERKVSFEDNNRTVRPEEPPSFGGVSKGMFARKSTVPEGEGTEVRANANCADRCHARGQCVYGRAHRYPDDALAYHQGRALEVMRARHAE